MESNSAQIRSSKKDKEKNNHLKPIVTNNTNDQSNDTSISELISPPGSPDKNSESFPDTLTSTSTSSSSSTTASPKNRKYIVINPFYDNILTFAFLFEIACLLYLFVVVERDLKAVLIMGITTVVTAYGVSISRGALKAIALRIGSQKALDKPRNIRKFVDQGWQLVVHFSMTMFEVYILWDKEWLQRTASAWEGVHVRPTGAVQALYLLQLGIRIWSSFSHRFLEAKHKDYFLMFTHHVLTIALLGGSYQGGFYKSGTLVLIVHNASDIVVDLLKMSNYMDLAGRKYFFMTEILFVTQLITWSICRLWYFPFRIMYSSFYEHNGCPLDCRFMRSLLFILLAMHIWWFYLFLRIGYRLVTAKSAHGAAREEYEGPSDGEGK